MLWSHFGATAAANSSPTAAVIVVADENSKIASLTQSEVEAIFLQKRVSGPSEQPFGPVFLPDDSAATKIFSERVIGKSVKQLRAYWNLKVLTGRLKPPVIIDTKEDLVSHLKRNPGSLGYLSETSAPAGLKILYKNESSP
jgi:ABC-type phosphate transport system substrate-binding protein